jgi:ABC-type antimicrobial peptide transport system permease subunit
MGIGLSLSTGLVAMGIGIMIFAGVAAGIFPAMSAMRLSIVDALARR